MSNKLKQIAEAIRIIAIKFGRDSSPTSQRLYEIAKELDPPPPLTDEWRISVEGCNLVVEISGHKVVLPQRIALQVADAIKSVGWTIE